MSHIRVVELAHDANGSLGLSIAGGVGSSLGDTPVIVANLTSGGPAERSRKLKVTHLCDACLVNFTLHGGFVKTNLGILTDIISSRK